MQCSSFVATCCNSRFTQVFQWLLLGSRPSLVGWRAFSTNRRGARHARQLISLRSRPGHPGEKKEQQHESFWAPRVGTLVTLDSLTKHKAQANIPTQQKHSNTGQMKNPARQKESGRQTQPEVFLLALTALHRVRREPTPSKERNRRMERRTFRAR